MQTPKISVIMATYNTPLEWLEESVKSILDQTFSDFEFIIVDDCSTLSVEPVKEKFKEDTRIIWIRNEKNLGLTKSLNIALKRAKGEYIARMDADDISLRPRFAVQVDYMDKHPEIIVCGSYRHQFGSENEDGGWSIPATREQQQVELFFYNCGLTHPTAMFRKSMLDRFGITYNENYVKAQDYGIWVQCTRYAPMFVIPKVLLNYRKSDRQATSNKSNVEKYDFMIKLDQLASLGITPTEDEARLHIAFCGLEEYGNADKIKNWVKKLDEANKCCGYFDKKLFSDKLRRRWYYFCKKQIEDYGNNAYGEYYEQLRKKYALSDAKTRLHLFVAKIKKGV